MISLTCTHCKTLLTMDDAFAGGVCRCQYCGTIQTVPSHLAGSAAPAAAQSAPQAAAQASGSKTLYRNHATGANGATSASGTALGGPPGSGLDEIAEIVASSGLSSNRLRHGTQTTHNPQKSAAQKTPAQSARASQKNLMPLLIVAGAVIAILLIAVLWLALRSSSKTTGNSASSSSGQQSSNPSNSTQSPPSPAPIAPGNSTAGNQPPVALVHKSSIPGKPSFLGTDLSDAASVVYVLDCGNATQNDFDALKQAALQSVRSLGASKKFAIVFWNNSDGQKPDVIYPSSGLATATAASIAECRKMMDPVYAFGQSDVKSALQKAIALHPSVIVLATGKMTDDDFSKEVLDAAGGQVKIDTFSLNLGQTSAPLSEIASKTGGVYRDVPESDLQNDSN